jgi:hypothetical protein
MKVLDSAAHGRPANPVRGAGSDDDLVITIDDVMAAGHCARGTRRWFDSHGLDFRKFLKQGIPAADMAATGDALGIDVVNRKRAAHGR